MIEKILRMVLPVAAAVIFMSCRKTDIVPPAHSSESKDQVELSIPVACSPFSPGSKSSFNPKYSEEYVTDLNVFVYKDGHLLAGSTYFTPEAGYAVLRFPDKDSSYDIFCLANIGRQYASEDESEMMSFSFDLTSLDSFRTAGLPMAALYSSVRPSDLEQLNLVHLVGAFDICFNNISSATEYNIKSLCIKNSARDLHPFTPEAASAVNAEGDFLSEEEIDALNRGESVRLYFTENLQGSLLPDNTDPLKRTPANIGNSAELCSYIEIVADAQTPTAFYQNNVYRAYVGENLCDDFSVTRNYRYELNLDYESDMIKEQDWTVTPGPYVVTGEIKVSSEVIPVFASISSDAVSCVDIDVPDGAEYTVSIQSSRNGIKIQSDADSETDEATGKTVFTSDGHFIFRSPYSMSNTSCGADPVCEDVALTIATTDGILNKTLLLKHYRSGFPIKFKYENGSLWVRATNPFSQRMTLSFSFGVQKSDGSWSCSENDAATLVPGSGWTQISTVPGVLLSSGASRLPDKCLLSLSVSFPDCEGIDILNPSASTMPFYIANMPDMIPSKGPSLVRKIGQYKVNRGFDGSILSYPGSVFGPSDRDWHNAYVAAELSNVSDASSFIVADKSVISKWNTTLNPTYLHSTDKYVVISSSGMDLGLCYEYGGNWYDFRNVMRLSSDDAAQYPVLAHFGHSLPYEQYEEVNRSITFTVNSQSWWNSFGINSTWFAED